MAQDPQQIVRVHSTTPYSAGSRQHLQLSLPMFCERHSTTDSHPISSRTILERRQVQNDCLPFTKLDTLNVASTRPGAVGLRKLTAKKLLVGITIQQLEV